MNGGDFNVHGKDQRKADFADLEGKGIKSSVLHDNFEVTVGHLGLSVKEN